MLSESRKKLKWSQDPQNTLWTNDTTAYGHKMLKKMGWEKGKGLGAKEEGVTEPIKLHSNTTKQGLGCTGYDNTWVAHQDDFSALLSELNNDLPSFKAIGTSNQPKVVSLEKTSKGQKRLHYKKFTKGKDLSTYNRSDMNAIFGLRSQSLPTTPLHGSDNDSDNGEVTSIEDKKRKCCKSTEKLTAAVNESSLLIPSDYSVTDYFKMKLEKLKQQKINKDGENFTSSANSNDLLSDKEKNSQISKDYKCDSVTNTIPIAPNVFDDKNRIKRKKKSQKSKSKKKKCLN